MVTTLVVTNDFPPRIGGIESFVEQVCGLLDHDVVVFTSHAGGASGDRRRPYPVVRAATPVLLPTPGRTRDAVRLLERYSASRVLFGAAAPLGLMAPALRRAGATRIVGLTHGHEVWWAATPGTRQLLRRIGAHTDTLTTISDYTAARIAPALDPAARARLVRLPPPVDPDLFRPRSRPGSAPGRRRCIAVGRFVPRKGLLSLLDAWRRLLVGWAGPPPELVLIGDGPQRGQLVRRVRRWGLAETVRFTGALDRAAVAAQLQAAHVLAFPVRTRLGGLDPEGLGLAAVEAAACGLPVVVGNSGGAPETVLPGRSGLVVDGRDPAALADAIAGLLADPARAAALGAVGRLHVLRRFGADAARSTLRAALALS